MVIGRAKHGAYKHDIVLTDGGEVRFKSRHWPAGQFLFGLQAKPRRVRVGAEVFKWHATGLEIFPMKLSANEVASLEAALVSAGVTPEDPQCIFKPYVYNLPGHNRYNPL